MNQVKERLRCIDMKERDLVEMRNKAQGERATLVTEMMRMQGKLNALESKIDS